MMTTQTENNCVHRATCRVLYGDTDAGGVVYYANYLRYFEFGRTEFMRDLVVPYSELQDEGLILPVVECNCRYKASARYDDLLEIETRLTEVRGVSCRFDYRILHRESGRLLALGYTVNAAVDAAGRLQRIPVDLVDRLKKVCLTQESSAI
jgi:acyl-CoA thioester hydrolase